MHDASSTWPLLAVAVALTGACLDVENGGRRGIERAAVCDFQARCGYIGASETAACARAESYGRLPFLDGLALGRESSGYSTSAAIAAGRLAIDPQREAACLEALTVGDCGATDISSCFGMYRGRVAAGRSCLDDHECVAGLCAVATADGSLWSGDPGCAGTCVGPVALGAACGALVVPGCGNDAFCDPMTLVCTPRSAEGEACGAGGNVSDCAVRPRLQRRGCLRGAAGTRAGLQRDTRHEPLRSGSALRRGHLRAARQGR